MSFDAEDAAFEERVRRSRETARRGWILAAILYLGFPPLGFVVLATFAERLGSRATFALLLLTSIALVAVVETARRVWRRPPT